MRSKWMQSSPRVKASVGRKDSIESQYLENDCDDVVFKPKDGTASPTSVMALEMPKIEPLHLPEALVAHTDNSEVTDEALDEVRANTHSNPPPVSHAQHQLALDALDPPLAGLGAVPLARLQVCEGQGTWASREALGTHSPRTPPNPR